MSEAGPGLLPFYPACRSFSEGCSEPWPPRAVHNSQWLCREVRWFSHRGKELHGQDANSTVKSGGLSPSSLDDKRLQSDNQCLTLLPRLLQDYCHSRVLLLLLLLRLRCRLGKPGRFELYSSDSRKQA